MIVMLYNSIHKDKIISPHKPLQNNILSNIVAYGILIVTVIAGQVVGNILNLSFQAVLTEVTMLVYSCNGCWCSVLLNH